MTKEDKILLLKDLCSRLPYGTRIHISHPTNGAELDDWLTTGTINNISFFGDIKPYLRPMSSMTEEEKNEFGIIACEGNIDYPYGIFFRCQDWLNKNMFDYRGLIEKGLAIAVTKENNPYKE